MLSNAYGSLAHCSDPLYNPDRLALACTFRLLFNFTDPLQVDLRIGRGLHSQERALK